MPLVKIRLREVAEAEANGATGPRLLEQFQASLQIGDPALVFAAPDLNVPSLTECLGLSHRVAALAGDCDGLVQDRCDFLVSIPLKGRVESLNASAAAAIVLFEAARQRAAGAPVKAPPT